MNINSISDEVAASIIADGGASSSSTTEKSSSSSSCSSSSSAAYSNTDYLQNKSKAFIDIMKSLEINEFEVLVPLALDEYAASKIITDLIFMEYN